MGLSLLICLMQKQTRIWKFCYKNVNYYNLVIRKKSEARKSIYNQKNAYYYVLKNLDTGCFFAEIFTLFSDKTDF